MLAKTLEDHGLKLKVNGDNLEVLASSPLTDVQREFIKKHKTLLITELNARSHVPYEKISRRYAYRFVYKNGDSGTWLTDVLPADAVGKLMKQFPTDELEYLGLLN